MTTRINWQSAGDSLHRLYDELTDADENWPSPRPDNPDSNDRQRRRARRQWRDRLRATYVTMARANRLTHDLIVLGAPLEVLTGASYTADELTHHLGMLVHLMRPFKSDSSPSIPRDALGTPTAKSSWSDVFARTVELFGFNLTISAPTYEAISAVSADPAAAQLAALLADSTHSMTRFGRETLEWLLDRLPPGATQAINARLPEWLAAYEHLCGGNPELLDALAGDEITLETRPGNLGSLRPNQIAIIFYDTLGSSVLPLLENLDCNATDAWQQHYRLSVGDLSTTPLAAAVKPWFE